MPKEFQMPNDEGAGRRFPIRHLEFVILSSFGLRHSSFPVNG